MGLITLIAHPLANKENKKRAFIFHSSSSRMASWLMLCSRVIVAARKIGKRFFSKRKASSPRIESSANEDFPSSPARKADSLRERVKGGMKRESKRKRGPTATPERIDCAHKIIENKGIKSQAQLLGFLAI